MKHSELSRGRWPMTEHNKPRRRGLLLDMDVQRYSPSQRHNQNITAIGVSNACDIF